MTSSAPGMQHMAMAVKPILGMVPPDPTSLAPRELLRLAQARRTLPRLGAEHFHALYKLMTMSSGRLPRRVVRVRAAQGDQVGERHHRHVPRPALAGTAYVLLHHYMGEIDGAFRAWGFAKGGTGAVSEAIAARRAARRRDPHRRAGRAGDRSKDGARGVVLENGDEIRAERVVSGPRPAPHVPEAVGEEHLPEVRRAIRRYKFRGSSGKVNLALGELPNFTCLPGRGRTCAARSRSARASSTSSAPTTTPSTASSRASRTWTSSSRR